MGKMADSLKNIDYFVNNNDIILRKYYIVSYATNSRVARITNPGEKLEND